MCRKNWKPLQRVSNFSTSEVGFQLRGAITSVHLLILVLVTRVWAHSWSDILLWRIKAATKKQKYERISEKKSSTTVEVLCKVSEMFRWQNKLFLKLVTKLIRWFCSTCSQLVVCNSISIFAGCYVCFCGGWCARVILQSLPCIWTIVAHCNLRSCQTTSICVSCSDYCFARWTSNMIMSLTGLCSNSKRDQPTRCHRADRTPRKHRQPTGTVSLFLFSFLHGLLGEFYYWLHY